MRMFMLRLITTVAITTSLALPAHAVEKQRMEALYEAAQQFLAAQLASYGDKATFELGKLDNRIVLAACAKLDVQLPPGNRLVGNSVLKIQCVSGARWALNLPIAVNIVSDYWVAARALPGGYEITESDLERRSGDLAQLPPSAITDLTQAVGRTVIGGIAAGAPLRSEALRPPYAVKANDYVKVIARGEGFEVASEGRAMGNANEGQMVSVKMASGTVVKGLARAGGTVEVHF